MPRQGSKRGTARKTGRATKTKARASSAPVFNEDLHVLDLGRGVMLDVFINVEGRLTTFVSVDGQLLAELRVIGDA